MFGFFPGLLFGTLLGTALAPRYRYPSYVPYPAYPAYPVYQYRRYVNYPY